MKKFNLFSKLVLLILLATFMSCDNSLLPSPIINSQDNENKQNSTAIWNAPENLIATHGLKSRIELTWQGVKIATRYYIYEANSPYEKFIQIGETTSNTTSYVIDEKSGVSKYYKITAVKKDGTESPFSIIAHGTTLATPVITFIGQDEKQSESKSSVHWYMNNCTTDTYLRNVRYIINCFDPSGASIQEKIHDGNSDYPYVIFENLEPNTNYTYQITAYIVSNQNETEISDKVDQKTSRKLIPNAVSNLSASLGTSASEIQINFELPNFVDMAIGNGIYEQKPLYFKIYRKLNAEEDLDSNWKLINGKFSKDDFKNQYTPLNPNQIYEPGQIVSYVDTNELKRGVLYDYKIQSYADETTREITSPQSCSTISGFLMAVPQFETGKYEAILDELGESYAEISTGFIFKWDMLSYEKDYGFILKEKKFKLEIDNGEVKDEVGDSGTFTYFDNIEAINEYVRYFDLRDEESITKNRGYYTYSLFIINKPGDDFVCPQEENFEFVQKIEAFGTTLVTQDTSKPEIHDFTTQDGYKDKILLSWAYDETIEKYTITYELEDGTEEKISDFSSIIEGKKNGDLITFQHDVESGFQATYTLTALRGISVETEPVKLSTLGTPSLEFDAENPEYDYISVSWNPVNKAEFYDISYSVDGKNYSSPIEIQNPGENVENPENFIRNADGSYTYNIVHPENYDDATQAGKNILVKIVAKSSVDSTNNVLTTKLLGPSLINSSAMIANSAEKIVVNWNKIPGVKNYLVKRDRYSVDNTVLESTDYYCVNAEDFTVTVSNEELEEKESKYISVSLENGNSFKLLDKPYQNNKNTRWCVNQDKISWGFPYRYTILPLANKEDSFDADTGLLAERVAYKNLSKIETVGSVIGYGHNVTATKSEDPYSVVVTWEKPYLASGSSYDPVLLRRKSGTDDDFTKTNTVLDISGNFFTVIPNVEERTIAYDYAIDYSDSEKLNSSYLEDLSNKIDENGESYNKGYTFSIEANAVNVPDGASLGFSEKIDWKVWDYSKRARGPKEDATYLVQLKNKNLGSQWNTLASFKYNSPITINNPSSYEASIIQQGNGIIITPNDLSSNDSAIHNGILKVLRDYKHYVKITVTRENSKGEVIEASTFAEKDQYMVRKITSGELCNNVALITADALYKCGIPYKTVSGTNSRTTTGNGESSTFKITGTPNNAFDYKNKVTWDFNNYKHVFNNGISSTESASFLSPFTLDSAQSSSVMGSDDNKLYHLPSLDITVSHESGMESYQGIVNMSIGKSGNSTSYTLTYKKNGTTVRSLSDSSREEFYKYFPYELGSDGENGDSSLNSEFIIYKSPWWN